MEYWLQRIIIFDLHRALSNINLYLQSEFLQTSIFLCLYPHTYFISLDIDECSIGNHTCSHNATCNNTLGSFNCTCKEGFSGDGMNCTGTIFSCFKSLEFLLF